MEDGREGSIGICMQKSAFTIKVTTCCHLRGVGGEELMKSSKCYMHETASVFLLFCQ